MQSRFITCFRSSVLMDDDSLNHVVTDLDLIYELSKDDFFFDFPSQIDSGSNINLVLNAITLKKNSVYRNCQDYFINNIYSLPFKKCFILNENKFIDEISFYSCHELTIRIVDTLKELFTHDISDNPDDEYVGLLIKENKSLVLPLKFDLKFLDAVKLDKKIVDEFVAGVFNESGSEKRSLFLNELISFLSEVDKEEKFRYLLNNLDDYLARANQSYEYYLRDFSYNKLKVEIDGKLLDFSQKLQSVINDSQNKLVAIPAGFVLVLTALDFKDILAMKNIVTIIGLCMFVLFLKIFIENQKSSLRFITSNINAYKSTFLGKSMIIISSTFNPIEKECLAQGKRIFFIEVLLWLVPVVCVSIITSIKIDSYWPYLLVIIYSLSSFALYSTQFYFRKLEINEMQ